jgi:hypothetical protein
MANLGPTVSGSADIDRVVFPETLEDEGDGRSPGEADTGHRSLLFFTVSVPGQPDLTGTR